MFIFSLFPHYNLYFVWQNFSIITSKLDIQSHSTHRIFSQSPTKGVQFHLLLVIELHIIMYSTLHMSCIKIWTFTARWLEPTNITNFSSVAFRANLPHLYNVLTLGSVIRKVVIIKSRTSKIDEIILRVKQIEQHSMNVNCFMLT